jgi:hypothetical protein
LKGELIGGSPLIGAGDPAPAPVLDFFAAPRNGRANVGAVEGPKHGAIDRG